MNVIWKRIVSSISEKIAWYQQPESRGWKRIWHFAKMVVISLLGIVISVILIIYGDGIKLQPALLLFTSLVSICSILMGLAMLKNQPIARWHIEIVTIVLIAAIGIAAIAAILMLQLQGVQGKAFP